MKKTLATLLAMIMTLSLASCANGSAPSGAAGQPSLAPAGSASASASAPASAASESAPKKKYLGA